MAPRRFRIALAAVTALAALVRCVRLGRDGLWTDEATTVVLASRSWSELLAALRADVQAPLHYALERAFLLALGDGEAAARALSVVAGVATVALLGALARRAAGERVALTAALLLALSPMHVSFSREARAYALLGLLALVAFFAVDALRRMPSAPRALVAGLALALLPWTHGLGPLHAAGLGLGAGVPAPAEARERRRWAWLLAAAAVAVAASLPWMIVTMRQGGTVAVAYAWAERAWRSAFPWQVPLSLMALAPGASAPVRSLWQGPLPLDRVVALVALALAVLAFRARRALPDATLPARLAAAVVAPLVAIFAVSLALAPVHVVGRAEAALAAPAALLVACGAASRAGRVLAGALVALMLVPLAHVLRTDDRSQERSMSRIIVDRAGGRDAVIVLGAYRYAIDHYVARERPGILVTSFPADREKHPSWVDWARQTPDVLRRDADAVASRVAAELRARGGTEAWVVAVPEPGLGALREAMDARFARVGRASAGPLELWHYRLR